MGVKRTSSLVLYTLFVFLLLHHFHSVSSSRPSSVGTNHEALPLNDDSLKSDVVGLEGKALELAVVIKKGGGGGGRGGGGSRGGGRSKSPSRPWIPVYTGRSGSVGSHRSSGNRNLQGTARAVGWLALSSVLTGLFLVQ
ncbi:PREDICTED: uncharacterized protein LOC104754879 [Camelina sativa]|uniref:Uncharacterized protein LOC104754879 n=1 Tax=Camelina sativa TaxID=90675 RepID=A0ABM0WSB8_CAMSA|nr:PREDICTED: uncharacterized protein LOC104754879 [Camelina sativa]